MAKVRIHPSAQGYMLVQFTFAVNFYKMHISLLTEFNIMIIMYMNKHLYKNLSLTDLQLPSLA